MEQHTVSIPRGLAMIAANLSLLAPRASGAEALTNYTAQVIARIGDKVGSGALAGGFGVSGDAKTQTATTAAVPGMATADKSDPLRWGGHRRSGDQQRQRDPLHRRGEGCQQ